VAAPSRPAASAANHADLFTMRTHGAVAPVITANFPLDGDADAMRQRRDRSAMGKIVAII
jgi:hypothetical protein